MAPKTNWLSSSPYAPQHIPAVARKSPSLTVSVRHPDGVHLLYSDDVLVGACWPTKVSRDDKLGRHAKMRVAYFGMPLAGGVASANKVKDACRFCDTMLNKEFVLSSYK